MKRIAEFQKKHGLTADGIIGRTTLTKFKEVFRIPSDAAVAHFIGQLHHESNGFKQGVESLNYSVSGLKKTFKFYRNHPELAQRHGRIKSVQKANQEAIANNVYADANRSKRFKLGNINPGDGWRFRGRGAIMITGRNNYMAFFKWLNVPLTTDPDHLAGKYFWHTALWFFKANNIWNHCNAVSTSNIEKVTRLINGGINGLRHRTELTIKYFRMLVR